MCLSHKLILLQDEWKSQKESEMEELKANYATAVNAIGSGHLNAARMMNAQAASTLLFLKSIFDKK